MTAASARPFIAAMQVTLDGYILGPDGEADWVDSWADGLELLPPVDAFVLGGGMFPDYEQFWAAIRDDPATAAAWLGRDPYAREVGYARVAAETPHLVLSTTLSDPTWPTARIVRDINELRAFKQQRGDAVYVVGGPRPTHQPDQCRPARRAPPDRAPSCRGKRDRTARRGRSATGVRAPENRPRSSGTRQPHLPAQNLGSGSGRMSTMADADSIKEGQHATSARTVKRRSVDRSMNFVAFAYLYSIEAA